MGGIHPLLVEHFPANVDHEGGVRRGRSQHRAPEMLLSGCGRKVCVRRFGRTKDGGTEQPFVRTPMVTVETCLSCRLSHALLVEFAGGLRPRDNQSCLAWYPPNLGCVLDGVDDSSMTRLQ